MTRQEFRDWVSAHGCHYEPVDGINHTGRSIKIKNKKYDSGYCYLRLPLDDTEMTNKSVCVSCASLHIPAPPEIDCP